MDCKKEKSFYETCNPEVRAAADEFIQRLKDGTIRSRHKEIYREEKILTPQELETERIKNKSW